MVLVDFVIRTPKPSTHKICARLVSDSTKTICMLRWFWCPGFDVCTTHAFEIQKMYFCFGVRSTHSDKYAKTIAKYVWFHTPSQNIHVFTLRIDVVASMQMWLIPKNKGNLSISVELELLR